MQLIDKVLLPVDFSESTAPVTAQAVNLCRQFGGSLVLVHVLEQLGGREEAEVSLRELQHQIESQGVQVHQAIVHHGNPHAVILSTANALDVNVIVQGAAPKSLAERLLGSTTANRVMHRAVMPVWCVHKRPMKNKGRILVAVDFSSASDQAMRTAVHLARNTESALHIVHVKESNTGSKDVQSHFDAYVDGFDLKDLPVTRVLMQGSVHEQILKAVDESTAELLVMGAYGQGSVIEQFIGNNADRVLRRAPCSVLTVKHQDLFKVMHAEFRARDAGEARQARQVSAGVSELASFIEEHYERGNALLEKGLLDDAIIEFKLCLDRDPMFSAAYDGISKAYERLGRPRKAEQYKEMARDYRKALWQQKVQSDVRRQHSLFNKGEGVG